MRGERLGLLLRLLRRAGSLTTSATPGAQPLGGIDMLRQHLGIVREEMVGAGDLAEIDLDVALVRQLVDQLLHRLGGNQGVLVALQDQPG